MKTLKILKSKRFVTLVALGAVLSFSGVDAFAGGHGSFKKKIKIFKNKHRHENRCSDGNVVGAPLDGGLITILLGGAGVAYFARKRKNKE